MSVATLKKRLFIYFYSLPTIEFFFPSNVSIFNADIFQSFAALELCYFVINLLFTCWIKIYIYILAVYVIFVFFFDCLYSCTVKMSQSVQSCVSVERVKYSFATQFALNHHRVRLTLPFTTMLHQLIRLIADDVCVTAVVSYACDRHLVSASIYTFYNINFASISVWLCHVYNSYSLWLTVCVVTLVTANSSDLVMFTQRKLLGYYVRRAKGWWVRVSSWILNLDICCLCNHVRNNYYVYISTYLSR